MTGDATTRTDLLVGVFILVTIGIVVGAMVRTSGFLEGRYRLYVRSTTAEGLSSDTRVYLQGLAVGRVQQVNPTFDSANNRLHFVLRLAMLDKFPDGSPLRLSVGTRAVVTQSTAFVGGQIVQLELPTGPQSAFLAPGDTIESKRVESVLNVLSDVATRLADDIGGALEETRALMARAARTVDASNALLRTSGPQLNRALTQLAGSLSRADSMIAALGPRADLVTDSIVTTLADTRKVLAHLDTLTVTAQDIADDNKEAIGETLQHLQRAAVILEHFSDKISRRPLRLLTGVTPPDTNTTEHRP